MQKLHHLSQTLASLGHSQEAFFIQKLGRDYVTRVTNQGLSTRFYKTARAIEEELYHWMPETLQFLNLHFANLVPEIEPQTLNILLHRCLLRWSQTYSRSIGSTDPGIPPWLFNFLDQKIFPLIIKAFSEALQSLPPDSETRLGLQAYSSAETMEKLGITNLSDFLDAGEEFWIQAISNLVHEVHHNILNPSAWKRFRTLGLKGDYHLLDALEEGLVIPLKAFSSDSNLDSDALYQIFSDDLSEFFISTFKRIFSKKIKTDLNLSPGEVIFKHWSLMLQHLDQIYLQGPQFKSFEDKISFLRSILDLLYENLQLRPVQTWTELASTLSSIILQVWSGTKASGETTRWDFLTGDDELLLIHFMEHLDQISDQLWNLWKDSKAFHFQISLKEVGPCIEKEIDNFYQDLKSSHAS